MEAFPDAVAKHRLRREIIATQLANSMINRGGPTLIARITDQTGASPAAIAAAFAAARDSYGLTELNAAIDALDAKIAGSLQLELYAIVHAFDAVEFVKILRLYELNLATGEQASQAAGRQILLEPDEVIASGEHVVRVVRRED